MRVSAPVRPLTALALAAACTTATLGAVQLISVRDEIAMGQQAQGEIRRQVPVVHDVQTTRYVEALGHRLAAQASGAEYPYSFTVADQRELNAFALPGGPIWINRGILEAATDEAQVAGVLAHEIAHVAHRHAARHLTKATVTSGVLGVLGAAIGLDRSARGTLTRSAAALTANGIMLKFGRDDEREADREGVRILQRAGFDPQGLPAFMEMLAAQQRRNPSAVEQFLSSHPAPAARVQALQADTASLPPGGQRDSAAFREVQARLRRQP